ncbi:hypothetical protein A3A52_05085 [Candidatus Woesebacteria bacterium RIFCSPLOWO2_01_FULL_39_14]|uniref:HNH domain-containing protein n=3 Tax=Candidatus Woeseibacteriota TaxID=1752722 RepID=A0A1F8BHG3_9BACT|nr:MAG: hypothetical protein A3A52_05085 [Candidatus Woesebacteria bacterium RIFCSPLOWO2_01_FULL_39_14]
MKICSKCKKKKVLFQFYKRKTGLRAGKYYEKCKSCMKVRGRKYYTENRDRQLPLANIRRRRYYREKRDFIINAKNRPCADCGNKLPSYVMDFDHRDGGDKIVDIARAVTANWSLNKIKAEIEKCDIVCANCHRMRTYEYMLR